MSSELCSSLLALCCAALATASLACSPPAEPGPDAGADTGDEPKESFESEIGIISADGDFMPINEADYVEIVVGFQGLIFLELAIRTQAEVPDRFRGIVTVVFDDAAELNFDSRHNLLEFETVGADRVCRLLQLPFGQDLPLIDEQRISTDLTLDATGWASTASAEFLIADRLDCIREEDGSLVCE